MMMTLQNLAWYVNKLLREVSDCRILMHKSLTNRRYAWLHVITAAILAFSMGPLTCFSDEQAAIEQEIVREEAEDDYESLLPSWGRETLREHGLNLEVLAINDSWGNIRGGKDRGVGSIGNMNVIVEADTEKLGMWGDGSFTFWGIWIYGQRPSDAVGDYQFTSSIDGPQELEPYEAYYEHSFLDGRITWLAGIHDFTLDFGILDYGFTFINSSFFTPSTITQVPYSFYPNTSWGTRGIFKATEDTYAMLGFYDGKPISNNGINTIDFSVSEQDGLYSIGELGIKGHSSSGYYRKVAFGAWHCSGDFSDISGLNAQTNYGTYLLGEHELWKEAAGSDQGFGAFAQVAQAQPGRNLNSWYYGGGLRYKGLVPDRDDDVIGVGIAFAQFSNEAREANPGLESNEHTYEVSYRAPLTGWLTLTPDAQFVVNPSGNPDLANDLILYVRSEVTL
jgi:porin